MPATATLRAPTIVPFAEAHLEARRGLLAGRHRAQRLVEPGLDPRYEDRDAARCGDRGAPRPRTARRGYRAGATATVSRLPPRRAPRRELGPERLGRARRPRGGVGRARARPLRGRRRTLGGRRPHLALRDGAGDRLRSGRRVVPPRLRASARARDPRGTGCPRGPGAARRLVLRLARPEDVDALARLDLALPEHQALSPVFSASPAADRRGAHGPSTRRTSTILASRPSSPSVTAR